MADDTKNTDQSVDFGILNNLVGYRLRRAQLNFLASSPKYVLTWVLARVYLPLLLS